MSQNLSRSSFVRLAFGSKKSYVFDRLVPSKLQSKNLGSKRLLFNSIRMPDFVCVRKKPFSIDVSDCIIIGLTRTRYDYSINIVVALFLLYCCIRCSYIQSPAVCKFHERFARYHARSIYRTQLTHVRFEFLHVLHYVRFFLSGTDN